MQQLGSKFRSTVGFALVASIRRKYRNSGGTPICLLKNIGDEICLVGVMKCGDVEFELIRQSNKTGKIHSFIDMDIDLTALI
jgi:hypothetical protein